MSIKSKSQTFVEVKRLPRIILILLYFRRIDASLNVKVADNALSRDLFPNDYHCLGDNENRPVKWLAIESLVHRTFSTASDVVSCVTEIIPL